MPKMTRREFVRLGAFALPAGIGLGARYIETTSLRVTHLDLVAGGTTRFVHFSDFHYKGDARFADEIVTAINQLAPQFVCFTGDIVEDRKFATEALSFIKKIQAPVYGCPGNHEYGSGISFAECARAFGATGGAWLNNRSAVLPEHDLELLGMDYTGMPATESTAASRHILLMHFPIMADRMGARHFDLILAGHSHGGQVRLPLLGPLIVPGGTGRYDFGFYKTRGGPLYVNAGVGTYRVPFRFNCRPELTLVTI